MKTNKDEAEFKADFDEMTFEMLKPFDRKLILEDGSEYFGFGFGDASERVLELVFNTSMVGYREILSDPSYAYQAVVMTYPLIGSYGVTEEDFESDFPALGALIVREYNGKPSNFRSEITLDAAMKKYKTIGISGVDTRKLTRSIKNFGSRKVLLTDASTPLQRGLEILRNYEFPLKAAESVSCKDIRIFAANEERFRVVAIDCGMKKNIIRSLNRLGCGVICVPFDISGEKIEALNPDGVFISNGPGDPNSLPETVNAIKYLLGKFPIFGICLGHQLLSLAYGGKIYKLKYGHRGGNHPVRNLETLKIEITSQNHSYAADADSLMGTPLKITHVNLLDNTVEGVECIKDKAFGVQYHPESSPGPKDSGYLFDRFIRLMEQSKADGKK